MSQTSLFHWQDQFQKALPRKEYFMFNITGAKTSSLILPQSAVLPFYDSITQAQIDAFFGSTNEILADKFDSTAMGTDAFGLLLNFAGQGQNLVMVEAYTSTGTGGATIVNRVCQDTGLTASSLTTQATLTTSGNMGIRLVLTGLDALTSGQIGVSVTWVSK